MSQALELRGRMLLGIALVVLGILALMAARFGDMELRSREEAELIRGTRGAHAVSYPVALGAVGVLGGIGILMWDRRDRFR